MTETKTDPWTLTLTFGDDADDDAVRSLLGVAIAREWTARLSFEGPGDDVDVVLKDLRWDDTVDQLGIGYRQFDETTQDETGPDVWVPLGAITGIHIY